ncbi:MAG: sigma factor-like helix-turn-helix DNA-binding protein, partial [Polyangiales bacterium]
VARVELLPSGGERADEALANAELGDQFTTKIQEFGKTLKDKEATIFRERLVAEDPKTLQALGDGFGVSRERVRQIEKRLLKKLKEYLRDELGDSVLEVYESP